MKNIDFSAFEMELENKLDTIFREDSKEFQKPKKKDNMLIIYPLHNLKNIVLSMEWEVTDELIQKYLKQLKYLREIFSKDKHILVLIRLQYILGNYIKKFNADAHPYAFKMVQTTFDSLDKLISAKNITDTDKRKILSPQIKRYNKLKILIEKNKTHSVNMSQSKSAESEKSSYIKTPKYRADNQAMTIYRLVFEKAILEMKRFIKDELEKLKIELQINKI